MTKLPPCRNAQRQPEPSLCSLPNEVLSIIFDALDFGSNKKELAAMHAVCKTLRTAVKLHPALIELQGEWTQIELAGWQSQPGGDCLSYTMT